MSSINQFLQLFTSRYLSIQTSVKISARFLNLNLSLGVDEYFLSSYGSNKKSHGRCLRVLFSPTNPYAEIANIILIHAV